MKKDQELKLYFSYNMSKFLNTLHNNDHFDFNEVLKSIHILFGQISSIT